MKRSNQLFLKDINNSIKNIENFIQGMTLDEFEKDIKTQLAIERCFEIIGEASKNISDDLKERYPDVSWKKWINHRNYFSHVYFNVKVKRLWQTAKNELSNLKQNINLILKGME